MMRTSSMVILLVAVAVGIGLFMVKYRVQDLEEQLVDLNRSIARDREAIRVLRAEWSHLNEPSRLKALANRYLGMNPVPVDTITTSAELERQIPSRSAKPGAQLLEKENPNSRKEQVQ